MFPSMDTRKCNKSKQSSENEHKKFDGSKKEVETIGARPLVAITDFRLRTLDKDNFIGGCKFLRDEIANHLGLDDAEKNIEWHYHQVRVAKKKFEGTLIQVIN